MYRNAMAKLLSWSDSPSRKPLIVNGARQVGKTWLVLAFGEDRYDSVAHIVFLDNEDMKRAFEGSLDAERLLTIIGAATGTSHNAGRGELPIGAAGIAAGLGRFTLGYCHFLHLLVIRVQ